MTDAVWKHSHEASPVTQKSQETLNQERKEVEHEHQREEIKALKAKKRLAKIGVLDEEDDDTQEKLEKSHNQWKDSHAADPKLIKADSTKWDNDWGKIEKQRESIKAIKEKQRISKLEAELNGTGTPAMDEETQRKLEASHNQWKDSHAKDVKVMKSNSTLGQDQRDVELDRKREEIKALQDKKRLAKLARELDEELSDDDTQEKLQKSHNQWKDSHARDVKVIKSKETLNQDRRDAELDRKREGIRAIKEKKRLAKMAKEYDEEFSDDDTQDKLQKSHNQWKDSHARDVKVIKSKETLGQDRRDAELDRKREEIRAIKEKKRLAKLAQEYDEEFSDDDTQEKLQKSHNQWKDSHARDVKVIKSKETLGQDRRDAELGRKREEIRAIKEKKRLAKLAHEYDEEFSDDDTQDKLQKSHNQWKDSHARDVKVIKSTETHGQDKRDAELQRKREEIRAIKQKKKLQKMQSSSDLADRNKSKAETNKKVGAGNMHEKSPKKMAAVERAGNDWNKIEKNRAEIKALKEKKRQQKALQERLDSPMRPATSRSSTTSSSSSKRSKLEESATSVTSDEHDHEEVSANVGKQFGGQNMHEKKPKKIAANTQNWDNDWDKIAKKREEIKAIKDKKKLKKMESDNDLADRNKHKKETTKKFGAGNMHDKKPKKMSAKERVGNDYDKIEKQRAAIKALKEKRKHDKEMGVTATKRTTFGNMHEK